MATRQTYSSASPPPVTGPNFADNVAAHFKRLYDSASFPLTAVGGTANAVTATLDPVLDGSGLVTGMRFGITWGTTNTGAMTLAINGGSPVSVLDAAGVAMTTGAAVAGVRAELEYVGGSFRVLTGQGGSGAATPRYYQAFTASGTWTKPTGLDDDTMVLVEGWGAGGGGGGGFGGGGGGGGYACKWFRLGDLPSSVTVTIGAGGAGGVNASGTAGGNTTFGSLLTAFGGGRGAKGTNSGQRGGGGASGGAFSAGGNATDGGVAGGTAGFCGSNGPNGWNGTSGGAAGPSAENSIGGGGGASGANASNGFSGGNAVNGGGGGGSQASSGSAGAGGVSLNGGTGGAGANSGTAGAGSAPGGGGGGSGQTSTGTGGAGARGEVRVWI